MIYALVAKHAISGAEGRCNIAHQAETSNERLMSRQNWGSSSMMSPETRTLFFLTFSDVR